MEIIKGSEGKLFTQSRGCLKKNPILAILRIHKSLCSKKLQNVKMRLRRASPTVSLVKKKSKQ
jgi:hypothetical protein